MPQPSVRRALSHEFSIHVSGDDALAAYLDLAYALLPRGRSAGRAYTVARRDSGYELALDGTALATARSRGDIITEVVHAVNAHATASWDGVVCHAGGVTRGETGFVFPARMEWGKTTLTAGLVRAGFDYLSDEAVAFVPVTGVIEPYPKPLSLDRGSWPLFPELDPGEQYASDQWHVAPNAIRAQGAGSVPGRKAGSVPERKGGRRCRAVVVAFACYQPGAVTELLPVSKGEALVEMAKNTFRFGEQGRVALEALAEIVRAAECYRFPMGDLDDACAVIDALADRVGP